MVFLFAMLWLQQSLNELPVTTISDKSVYLLTTKESLDVYRNKLTTLDASQITSISIIYKLFSTALQSRLAPIIHGYGLFLIISAVLLWVVLKRFYSQTVKQIAQGMEEFDNLNYPKPPELTKAFQLLKEKNTASIEDFKRLYNYLSHEQKNAISILQQTMELHENKEDLECLDHVAHGIDDVLTLSENEASSEKTEVNIIMICAEVCDYYHHVSDAITFEYEEDIEPMILAKERWIIRAVSNLLDNAIKYGQGQPVEVTVKNQRHCVIITVRDHGIGISEEEQKRIFEYWYRVSPLKKDGYGIGLSLVSHVCDLCGGFATVESELGKGSTFYLSFPCIA